MKFRTTLIDPDAKNILSRAVHLPPIAGPIQKYRMGLLGPYVSRCEPLTLINFRLSYHWNIFAKKTDNM